MAAPSPALDLRHVAAMAAEQTTDDLLDTWAFFRDELEVSAQNVVAAELARRGVSLDERALAAYRARRGAEVLATSDARVARCRYCARLPPHGLPPRFSLLLLLPLSPPT